MTSNRPVCVQYACMIKELETCSPGKFNVVPIGILVELMKTCRIEENIDSGREKSKFSINYIMHSFK